MFLCMHVFSTNKVIIIIIIHFFHPHERIVTSMQDRNKKEVGIKQLAITPHTYVNYIKYQT